MHLRRLKGGRSARAMQGILSMEGMAQIWALEKIEGRKILKLLKGSPALVSKAGYFVDGRRSGYRGSTMNQHLSTTAELYKYNQGSLKMRIQRLVVSHQSLAVSVLRFMMILVILSFRFSITQFQET